MVCLSLQTVTVRQRLVTYAFMQRNNTLILKEGRAYALGMFLE